MSPWSLVFTVVSPFVGLVLHFSFRVAFFFVSLVLCLRSFTWHLDCWQNINFSFYCSSLRACLIGESGFRSESLEQSEHQLPIKQNGEYFCRKYCRTHDSSSCRELQTFHRERTDLLGIDQLHAENCQIWKGKFPVHIPRDFSR